MFSNDSVELSNLSKFNDFKLMTVQVFPFK